jgi:pterin-4a-carbinolamine dehydratase
MADIPAGWELRGKPPTLFRRFEFPRYAATRDFLDALAGLSEAHKLHPQNINFGGTYANISLEIAEGESAGAAAYDFAARVNALYPSQTP